MLLQKKNSGSMYLFNRKIYHFKCNNEGEFVQAVTVDNPHHNFLILSPNTYNNSNSHYSAVVISTKASRTCVQLDPDDFEQGNLPNTSFVLIDKVCRIPKQFTDDEGPVSSCNSRSDTYVPIKLTNAAYEKVLGAIRIFMLST